MKELLWFLDCNYASFRDVFGTQVYLIEDEGGSVKIFAYDPVTAGVYFTAKVVYTNSKGRYIRYRKSQFEYVTMFLSEFRKGTCING